MRNDGDDDRRGDHQSDREQTDIAQIRTEVAPGGRPGVRVQQRRQEDEEHEVRRKLDARQPRHKAQQQPTEHQQDWIGHLEASGGYGQQRDKKQK